LDKKDNNILVPPPSPPIDEHDKIIQYVAPEVVENADENLQLETFEEIKINVNNIPMDVLPEPVNDPIDEIIEDPEVPVLCPEEEASFMGSGIIAFRTWVMQHITYPPVAIENGIFGKVIVQFCVNSKGEIVDISIIRNLDSSVDNEVLRVIRSSPLWTPAKQGGRAVKQRFTIPIIFKLE